LHDRAIGAGGGAEARFTRFGPGLFRDTLLALLSADALTYEALISA
jgi:hypothetical protein